MAVLNIAGAAVTESNTNTVASFVVSRSDDTTSATVQYRTLDGSAVAGEDYSSASDTLTFNIGDTTKTISVTILPGDRPAAEGMESFSVQLLNPTGDTIGTAAAAAYIADDDAILVVGPEKTEEPRIRVFDPLTGAEKYNFLAYGSTFTGGVRVATGDVTGDGVIDIITAAGEGGGPQIRVFDGATPGKRIASFYAFPSNYAAGVHIAAGDFDGDSRADLIVGTGAVNSVVTAPTFRVFSGSQINSEGPEQTNPAQLWSYQPFDDLVLAGYKGGVHVAAGDVTGAQNGIRYADVIVGTTAKPVVNPGTAAEATVRVYDATGAHLKRLDFKPYGAFTGGVYVGAGDIDADGKADVITGAGKGGGPQVRAYSGVTAARLLSFFAYDSTFTGGVRVSGGDVTGDGLSEIVTGPGPGAEANIRIKNPHTLATLADFVSTTGNTAGIFVGADGVDWRKDVQIKDISAASLTGWTTEPAAAFLQGNEKAAAGASTATWTFDQDLTPGVYRISATWTHAGDRAADATYTIKSGGTTLGTASVNQQAPPNSLTDAGLVWGNLGNTWSVTASDITVELTSAASGYEIADAIRIERLHAFTPVIAVTGSSLTYTENAELAVDAGLLLGNTANGTLASAEVHFSSGYTSGQDALTFVNQSGINGSFNTVTGVLSLTGTAPVAAYQTALRSVKYINSSDNPATHGRTIQFTVNDGALPSNTAARAINVISVNDRPTLNPIGTVVLNEDAGLTEITLTGITAGPGESQSLSIQATSTNPSVIVPSVSYSSPGSTGLLQFTPVADAYGNQTITVTVTDSGGTANGGVAAFVQTFTVQVNPVNDQPSFSGQWINNVIEDAGPRTIAGWASFSAGAFNENAQTATYLIRNVSNPGLFAALPSVSTSGTLSYTPAANASGSSTFEVAVRDSGGTLYGGVDTSEYQQFTITVDAVPDVPSVTNASTYVNTQTTSGLVITANPADGANLTGYMITGITGGTLFQNDGQTGIFNGHLISIAQGAAGLKFTPTPGSQTHGSFQVEAWGSSNGENYWSPAATATITVLQPNQQPSFTATNPPAVNEEASLQTLPYWATFNPGANESGQTPAYTVRIVDNPGLFAYGPSVNSQGTLFYRPVPNAYGTATFEVIVQDNGGTAGGGVDTSAPLTFTITVNPINDAPSFTPGPSLTVDETAGAQTITNWATNISAGAGETEQVFTFRVNYDHPELFTLQPTVAPDGTLRYTPAIAGGGVVHLDVWLHDFGTPELESPVHTVTITINGLSPVTNLAVNASIPGDVQLTWNPATAATSYDIYRKPDGGTWELIGSTTETNYADSSVPSDGRYAYGVVSRNSGSSSAMVQSASTFVFTAAGDYDDDGLNNLGEHYAGTNPANFDTDGDLLPDGWEVSFALNPTNSDEDSNGTTDQNDDFDDDNLTNLGEFNRSTDPINPDTDGDGTLDGAEVNQGSDPVDAADGGQPPASDMTGKFTVTVGDPSGSHSERWALRVGDIQRTAPDFGQVGSEPYFFKVGETYDVTLKHLGTNLTGQPDYDWYANLAPAAGTTTPYFVVDTNTPLRLVGSYQGDGMSDVVTGSAGFAGKHAKFVLPQLDADVDSKNDSGFAVPDDNPEEDRIEQDTSTGKIVFPNTGDFDADGVIDSQDFDGIIGRQFVPMVWRLSQNISEAQPSQINLTATYDSTKLRIWMPGKDAAYSRSSGDIIASGSSVSASSFGLSPGGNVVVFVEALAAFPSPLPIVVKAQVTGTNWSGTVSDTVHVINGKLVLTASDDNDRSNYVSAMDAAIQYLYLPEDPHTNSADLHTDTLFASEFDPEYIHLTIRRSDGLVIFNDDLGDGRVVDRTLDVTGEARDFAIMAWLDENNNGLLDGGEEKREVKAHVKLPLLEVTNMAPLRINFGERVAILDQLVLPSGFDIGTATLSIDVNSVRGGQFEQDGNDWIYSPNDSYGTAPYDPYNPLGGGEGDGTKGGASFKGTVTWVGGEFTVTVGLTSGERSGYKFYHLSGNAEQANWVDKDTPGFGGLLLGGGGTDDVGAQAWFGIQAGAGDVVVIGNKYSESELADAVTALMADFGGPGNIHKIHAIDGFSFDVDNPESANLTQLAKDVAANKDGYGHEFLSKLAGAEAVYFLGGDQWPYVQLLKAALPAAAIISSGNNGHRVNGFGGSVVVGGTSAGLAILGEYVFTSEFARGTVEVESADILENYFTPKFYAGGKTSIAQGLLSLKGMNSVLTETHFTDIGKSSEVDDRNIFRLGRFLAFMGAVVADAPSGLGRSPVNGLAVDEDTFLCVDNDGNATVYGRKNVYFASASSAYANYDSQKVSVFGDVRMNWYSPGQDFTFASAWTINSNVANYAAYSLNEGVLQLVGGKWPNTIE